MEEKLEAKSVIYRSFGAHASGNSSGQLIRTNKAFEVGETVWCRGPVIAFFICVSSGRL